MYNHPTGTGLTHLLLRWPILPLVLALLYGVWWSWENTCWVYLIEPEQCLTDEELSKIEALKE